MYSELAHKLERKITPIDDNTQAILPHEVFPGPREDSPVLVFLHGWPDDLLLFRAYAQELSKEYHCVNCTMPGYPTPENFNGHAGTVPKRNWGYGFEDAMHALKSTIQFTCQGRENSSGITLVLHDWGCVVGHMLIQDGSIKIHRIVGMDVGGRPSGLTVPFVAICFYQVFLAIFFMLPAQIGDFLSAFECWLLGRTLAPCEDKKTPVTAAKGWLYRAVWREMLTPGTNSGGIKPAVYFSPPPGVPFYFLYSSWMPEMFSFFDYKFLAQVEATTAVSKTLQIKGNHWFPTKSQTEVMDLISKWLQETHEFKN